MKIEHPKGIYFLSAIEMWERFSYYGMRALLTLYMVKFLLFSTEKAGHVYGLYTGLVYATPLIGGYIADRYLGAKKCILIGSIIMALGHFLMAVSSLPFFYMALGFLIIGNGFFKPNISTIVGKLYHENDHRRDSGFTIFYMGINIGAFLSPLICGTLGEKIGFHYGFGAAGIGMVIGLFIYLWGHKKYIAHIGLEPIHCIDKAKCDPEKVNVDEPLTKEDWYKIAAIFILMFFTIFFWASFEQAGSSMTLFADRSTNRIIPFLNWEFPASYFQAVNPLIIIFLAPLFSSLWIKLADVNRDPSTPVKFVLGLAFVSIGFLLMAFAAYLTGIIGQVSFVWLICVYFFHTVGELCISPVGLSVVTKLSPVKFASLLMGVWFLSSFFANYLSGVFAGSYDSLNHITFFLLPAFITGGSAIILAILAKPLKKLMQDVE